MKTWMKALGLLAIALAILAAGCNSSTDDPGISGNLVSISAIDPTEACVDVDGALLDLDGDGTKDDLVFVSTENAVNFESITRGLEPPTGFKDVNFTRMDVVYEITAGPQPPSRLNEGIAITVPAGGTAEFPLTTVFAQDIIDGFFTGDTRGSIRITFRGADLAGEPATTTGLLPIRAVSVCEGQ